MVTYKNIKKNYFVYGWVFSEIKNSKGHYFKHFSTLEALYLRAAV